MPGLIVEVKNSIKEKKRMKDGGRMALGSFFRKMSEFNAAYKLAESHNALQDRRVKPRLLVAADELDSDYKQESKRLDGYLHSASGLKCFVATFSAGAANFIGNILIVAAGQLSGGFKDAAMAGYAMLGVSPGELIIDGTIGLWVAGGIIGTLIAHAKKRKNEALEEAKRHIREIRGE